jgi:hypothetical protein
MTMANRSISPDQDMDREEIRMLRNTAERLRELAKLTFDRRTASSIAVCAAELEREVRRREIRKLAGMAASQLSTAQ